MTYKIWAIGSMRLHLNKVQAAFAGTGCEVRVLGSAIRALAAMDETLYGSGEWPDLFIIDYVMKHQTGLEILRSARARNCLTPAIMTTDAVLDRSLISDMIPENHVVAVLRKPVVWQDLVMQALKAVSEEHHVGA